MVEYHYGGSKEFLGRGIRHVIRAEYPSCEHGWFKLPFGLCMFLVAMKVEHLFRGRIMRIRLVAVIIFALACLWNNSERNTLSAPFPPRSGWVLTWHDEFNGPPGSAPDPTKWVLEKGGNGWGNNELEYYTGRIQNVRQDRGNLVIEAIREKYIGPDGIARNYTSARIKSQGQFSQEYGRFESRIRLPTGKGLWPAFWMLGDDFEGTGWPNCGEIDIMESFGFKPFKIFSSLHGPGYSGKNSVTRVFTFPAGHANEDFHDFAAEWVPQVVRFFVDGELYATGTPVDLPSGARWVFDHPFFIVLNLAVGGNLPGNPDESTVFPQRMLVDYVRVYALR